MKDDAKVATSARALVQALMDVAYSRKDEDKKRVSAAQTDLCRIVREETEEEPANG